MAEEVDVAIESALMARLQLLTLSPAVPVAYPEVPFTPPVQARGAAWLKADFMPAPTLPIAVGFDALNQHQGIFQVTVFYNRGEGEYRPKRIASMVMDWFVRGTTVTKDGFSATITRPPFQGVARVDPAGGWLMIPVSIPYLAFAGIPA